MRIRCPYCGERDLREFVCRGAAPPARPDPDTASDEAWIDHVYLRDNPAGPVEEAWHHVFGCRAWLGVTRDNRTHEVISTVPAIDRAGGA